MTTTSEKSGRLDLPIDRARDHVLGDDDAEITLIEYGSYACRHCHAAHQVVNNLRERFGNRLRYVYRHLPLTDRTLATRAAELAEYASLTGDRFWEVHDLLMSRSHEFSDNDLDRVATELNLQQRDDRSTDAARAVASHVRDDAQSGLHGGARATPTFFINGRRYDGAWDESSLGDALLGSIGHRLRTASIDFASWAPSTGLLLLVMSVLAIAISNSPLGPAFDAWWHSPFGVTLGDHSFMLPLVDWVNDGLLTVFFLVVGLEIKRELTIGRLSTPRAAALPIAGAIGGMTIPAIIYLAIIAPDSLAHGWGMTIATDTAFAVALIVILGNRVPVDLRVFLTAAVIVDDLVAIGLVAVYYSDAIVTTYLLAATAVTALLVSLNRSGVYRALPYAVLGVLLWVCLHEAGLHATLAGVILAAVTPTRAPANLDALMAQAQAVIQAEHARERDREGRASPAALSRPALEALDVVHDRIESPASKLLRGTEPWSSYFVLPIFALANAGVAWSPGMLNGRGALVMAIVLGLVVGKPTGILAGSWLAARLGIAYKPDTYSWRQLLGAGALAGIGFTMSLFIAGQSFTDPDDFMAAKIAIFIASIIAGSVGTAILWRRRPVHPQ